jgi:2-polyprenyl-6-methoxyphenol hydroxylase-like FAD-dependent oxidoreductase
MVYDVVIAGAGPVGLSPGNTLDAGVRSCSFATVG